MGYSTDFQGRLAISPQIDEKDATFVNRFSQMRHMKRDISRLATMLKITESVARDLYGPEGEFFIRSDLSQMGQERDESIVDYNEPPSGQPGLWCQWIVEDSCLVWDGGEKFYYYVEWLQYLIDKVFIPRGYRLNGEISWIGEDPDDCGTISVTNNIVTIIEA